jgi:cytoskeleton protein RodZ
VHRGLSLEEAAATLRVPAKSLRALEWDRPDLLGSPGQAYDLQARYAAFLGLAREALTRATEEEAPREAPPAAAPRWRLRRTPTPALWLPMLAALAPAVVIVAVLVLGRTGEGESAADAVRGPRVSSISTPENGVAVTSEKSVTVTSGKAPAPAPRRHRVNLVLTAEGGGSWVEAHSDSATGPLLFQGTLQSGRELRLAARRIWLRLGAASNLSLAVNGRATPSEFFGTVDVLVTPQGIEPA